MRRRRGGDWVRGEPLVTISSTRPYRAPGAGHWQPVSRSVISRAALSPPLPPTPAPVGKTYPAARRWRQQPGGRYAELLWLPWRNLLVWAHSERGRTSLGGSTPVAIATRLEKPSPWPSWLCRRARLPSLILLARYALQRNLRHCGLSGRKGASNADPRAAAASTSRIGAGEIVSAAEEHAAGLRVGVRARVRRPLQRGMPPCDFGPIGTIAVPDISTSSAAVTILGQLTWSWKRLLSFCWVVLSALSWPCAFTESACVVSAAGPRRPSRPTHPY